MSQSTSAAEDARPARPAEALRVSKILIEGLFRRYDHIIELRKDERVTILHGKNGVGKTVTLELIEALLGSRFGRLFESPFRRLRIDFSNGSWISAMQVENVAQVPTIPRAWDPLDSPVAKSKGSPGPCIQVEGQLRPGEIVRIPFISKRDFERLVGAIVAPFESQLRPRDSNQWMHIESGELFTNDDLLEMVRDESFQTVFDTIVPPLSGAKEDVDLYFETIKPLHALCADMGVYFIDTHRLQTLAKLSNDAPFAMHRPSVAVIAEEISDAIRQIDSDYRTIAVELDNSLPHRLFRPMPGEPPSMDELVARNEALEKVKGQLRKIGLLESSPPAFDLRQLGSSIERAAMFAVYLEDSEKKLNAFNVLAEPAELLLRYINKKLAPKRMVLDKDKGYRVFTHDGQPLALERLSSGEQHELVLMHTIFFHLESGTLLLIDEPEISLHVIWQNELLDDLLDIAKLVGIDIILATHSPYIVGYHRELMVQLGGPE